MFNISLGLIIKKKKKKEKDLPIHPDLFYEFCPLWSQSPQSCIDRYVSGPVIASEWCALIACKLLQHHYVCLSLEGATELRVLCETGRDRSHREVPRASFPSASEDLIPDESIPVMARGWPLLRHSVFTLLICKSSDRKKPLASLSRF